MDREDDKELWDMLSRIPEPTLSPFFARNVVRRVRQEATPFERARSWFSLRRLVAASAVAVVVTALAIATHHPVSQTPAVNDADAVAKIDPPCHDIGADVEEVVAAEDKSWGEHKPTWHESRALG